MLVLIMKRKIFSKAIKYTFILSFTFTRNLKILKLVGKKSTNWELQMFRTTKKKKI